jgi:hypothetical protein
MISDRPQPCGAWTETSSPDAAYREEFLKLLGRLELEPAHAIALVEAVTGRPFESCSPMQLVPLLQQLLEFLHPDRSQADARQRWHA